MDAGKKNDTLRSWKGNFRLLFQKACYFSLHIVSLDYQGSSVWISLSFSLMMGLLLRILVIGRGY